MTMPAKNDDITSAKRVLSIESESLKRLAESLSTDYSKALDLLSKDGAGRIIICGMGKSGHIARKIAATLSSTGTPSHYVHPGEASHGDLGMITIHDSILALSNSGETPELEAIISYAKRFAIPLIAISSNRSSILAEAADVLLLLPESKEACPMGLAPTTSTTMMLALGDAIAVTLLERKGFTSSDFKVFHPGGQLGKGLLKVSDLMHHGDSLPLVKSNTLMSEVILEMTHKSFGCVGIIDDSGSLTGVITDGDLRRHMSRDLLSDRAENIMTRSPKTIEDTILAVEALRRMTAEGKPITSLFVVDSKQKPMGIIHLHDCLRAGII
jgi:arabinose-5-phosphate isomerase